MVARASFFNSAAEYAKVIPFHLRSLCSSWSLFWLISAQRPVILAFRYQDHQRLNNFRRLQTIVPACRETSATRPKFMAQVKHYAMVAGLQLNASKTQLFGFRPPSSALMESLALLREPFSSVKAQVTFLGVEQYQDFNTQRRFLPLLPKLKAKLVAWRFRGRTLHGRKIILRAIVLPLLWYPAAVTPLPPSVIESV